MISKEIACLFSAELFLAVEFGRYFRSPRIINTEAAQLLLF